MGTVAAFAIGRWAVGSVTVAVFGTFTGLAITGIADFGGSMRGRAPAVTTTVVLGIGLTALGTWISGRGPWVGCAVMFVVVAVIALSALLGGYAAAGSNALILFYVVAAGSAAPVAVIPDRLEGVALGGALALVAAVALWPEPEHSQTLPRLGAALRQLAERIGRLARGDHEEVAPSTPTPGIRTIVDALVDRPAAPTGAQRAELYLVNDIERLTGLVTRLDAIDELDRSDRAILRQAASSLRSCADALSNGRASDESELDTPADWPPGVSPFSVPARLSAVADAVMAHTRAALGRAPDDVPLDAFTTGPSARGGWADVIQGWRRLQSNLTLESVHVHDALRLGAGLAVASAAVDAFGLEHGFWVAFATLTVIKSNLRGTGRSVGEAITGTLIGFLVAFALISVAEPSIGWYLALLPVVVTAAIYANAAVSFLAGQAGFTLVIIVLFNLLGPAGWRVGIVRVVDVVAGALAGLLIGALAWPRGASANIGTAAADLLEAGASYLAATARAFIGQQVAASAAASRRRAADAAVRAESSFAQYLTEHPPANDLNGWTHWLSTGNRLWYAADLIAASPHSRDGEPAEAVRAADRLTAGYKALAASLRGRRRPPAGATARPAGAGPALTAWLDDLTGETNARPAEKGGVRGGI
jgi:uncharacterized membrane protein YccC